MMRVCHFIYNNDEAIENKIANSKLSPKDTTEYNALLAVDKVNSLQNKFNGIFPPDIQ